MRLKINTTLIVVLLCVCCIAGCKSSASVSENDQGSGTDVYQKPDKTAYTIELHNELGRNTKFWFEYVGPDTMLSCLHRLRITESTGDQYEKTFATQHHKALPLISQNYFEISDWFNGEEKIIAQGDTFPMVFLPDYDTILDHRSLIPVILTSGQIDYAQPISGNREKTRLKLILSSEEFEISPEDDGKILPMYLVMVDMKNMKMLNSVECKWLPIVHAIHDKSENIQLGQSAD